MVQRIISVPPVTLIEANQYVLRLLLENTSVSENRKIGEKSPTVRYINFKDKTKNSFVAISQFKVRVLGTENHIIPDITLFINGLPVAVIECKSSKVKEPIAEAIDQFLRYSQQRGKTGEEEPGNDNAAHTSSDTQWTEDNRFDIQTCLRALDVRIQQVESG